MLIDDQVATELNLQLQRIFCLPITRSTYRDLYNVSLVLAKGDQQKAGQILEVLFTGTVKPDRVATNAEPKVRQMIERFTISCRMSKEVFEKGDFIGNVTSEMLTQEDKAVAINRIRKIDGEELQFATDAKGTLYLVHHFLTRLEEFSQIEGAKKDIESFSKEIADLQNRLSALQKGSEA